MLRLIQYLPGAGDTRHRADIEHHPHRRYYGGAAINTNMTRQNYQSSYYARPNHAGSAVRRFLIGVVVVCSIVGFLHLLNGHAHAISSMIKSGIAGNCLDDHLNGTTPNNPVDAWGCNDSNAQSWTVSGDLIKHQSTSCLSVDHDATTGGSPVVIAPCTDSPGQIWLRQRTSYFNPHSGLCLTAPAAGQALIVSNCHAGSSPDQTWQPAFSGASASNTNGSCRGVLGQRVACYAEQQWTTWQGGSSSHNDLLNTYSDGAGYEQWCADFVSYVYKQAGHPFTSAYDGWDESSANNIQNQGFTLHLASSGYIPQAGDVAYFNYPGGHVEVVVSGGKTPTFVYGDSGTTDPTTGNGQMAANTITTDGTKGQIIYYLSPVVSS